jgi:uncharacterized protein YjlB
MTPDRHRFADDGRIPNHPDLPLLVYQGILDTATPDRARGFEALFAQHGWDGTWRNGVYGFHHYHSTAHEVLGIARGSARVRLGGENGQTVEVGAGDVVVIPAGVAHKREAASGDLLVIGAYPRGQSPDICQADPARHNRATAAIARVPLPEADPVTGGAGPLLECWRDAG